MRTVTINHRRPPCTAESKIDTETGAIPEQDQLPHRAPRPGPTCATQDRQLVKVERVRDRLSGAEPLDQPASAYIRVLADGPNLGHPNAAP